MNFKLAVIKIEPHEVRHIREVLEGTSEVDHPFSNVAEHQGTGKATCRGCGEIIKEGEPAIVYFRSRYDKGHKLEFIKDRGVIHATGCTEDLVKCPCGKEIPQNKWSEHVKEHDRPWQLRKPASIIKICMLHKLEHCGQCEEDRKIEGPKLREELLKLLEVTASIDNEEDIVEFFDYPDGYVEEDHTAAGGKSTRDIAQEVTDRIVATLESGSIPWKKPWAEAAGGLPTSAHGRAYRGINLLLLAMQQQDKGYDHPIWITYDQAKKLGGTVKKGEKSTLVTFRKRIQVPDRNDIPAPGEEQKKRTIPLLRHYNVFNIGQTDGVNLPPRLQRIIDRPKPEPVEVLPAVQDVINGYKNGPPISHIDMAVGAPNYQPGRDAITLPHPHQFSSPEAYASTVFHELTHSTGHASRLDRFSTTGEPSHFGTALYAQEELVAELGNAMLMGHTGVESPTEQTQNAGYIQSWLTPLKNDKNFIIQAAGKAQRAVDHILGINPEEFADEEAEQASERLATSWRHTEDDGFEMWETTEKHNEFAIVEAGEKYDLYVLQGSFDSPEEAKAAAGTTKTAQDGGGGGASGGGSSGGGASGGGDGGSSGGDGGGDGGAASGGGAESSTDSGFSSGTEDSESDPVDGDEDPRPPSGSTHECPRCHQELNPIYLVGGGRVYTCKDCGYTYRKKRRLEASWFDRIPVQTAEPQTTEEPEILPINPVLPPILFAEESLDRGPNQDASQIFSMN